MNDNCLNGQFPDLAIRNFESTFHETSARKVVDDGEDPLDPFVVSESNKAGGVRCLDFDNIKLHYYPPRPSVHTPCSVDAVTFEMCGTFLIEFKFKTAKLENITRKIYDSVMLFIEKNGFTFERARKEFTYIVVSSGLRNWKSSERALLKAYSYCKNPWVSLRACYDRWKLESLEGVVVKAAYAMPPDMFEFFVGKMHWR